MHLVPRLIFRLLLPVAAVAAAIAIDVMETRLLPQAFLALTDAMQRLLPRPHEPQPVAIVELDDESIAPFPARTWVPQLLPAVIDRLNAVGAAVIALDIGLPAEEEQDGPHLDALVRAISRSRAPVILAVLGNREPRSMPRRLSQVQWQRPPQGCLPVADGFDVPIRRIEDAATAIGNAVVLLDLDFRARRAPMFVASASSPADCAERACPVLPNFVLEAVNQFLTFKTRSLRVANDTVDGPAQRRPCRIMAVGVGGMRIPTDGHGAMWVNFAGSDPKRFVQAHRLVTAPTVDDVRRLKGALVFVGTSFADGHDFHRTPLGDRVPGVEINAEMVEQILSRRHLARPDWTRGADVVLVMVSGLALMLAGLRSPRWWRVVLAAAVAAAVTATFAVAYHSGLVLDPIPAILAVGLTLALRQTWAWLRRVPAA